MQIIFSILFLVAFVVMLFVSHFVKQEAKKFLEKQEFFQPSIEELNTMIEYLLDCKVRNEDILKTKIDNNIKDRVRLEIECIEKQIAIYEQDILELEKNEKE